ncbi:MAG: polymerase elongation factor tau and gamma subunit [Pseudomonadota bacterium]|jgi:DNA polymerase-3 subunit gamma/tau
MSYQVLARKWRPKSFETLIGQEHVVRALTNALEQQRLHHAYLLTGTRGVGKTTIARILAKSLNCETGITAHPCGVCSACVDIDKGRFIDLIEVDAASNTQVDNMRDLLDNAQYAPTAGRFKVYIIDEVHMLSRSSFNAMLKTLEEPPAHVKFILATTDPQKMPVTVLSRCLQFNLRQMASTSITEHCQAILKTENIPFEVPALQLIAKAASGSMRDALSLLDQAIAYGSQSVQEKEVRTMLGAIDQSYLIELLKALIQNDGEALMSQAKAMSERSIAFDAALGDLANLLQQVAMTQVVPNSIALDLPERPALLELAQQISAEKVQLYYQIALLGRRDIGLAPDEYAGFTMSLLRMLAFNQSDTAPAAIKASNPVSSQSSNAASTSAARPSASAALKAVEVAPQIATIAVSEPEVSPTLTDAIQAPLASQRNDYSDESRNVQIFNREDFNEPSLSQDQNTEKSTIQFNGNWRGLVDALKLGLARTLAQNCELESFDENNINLTVPDLQKHLLDPNYQEKLSAAINQHFGRKIKLSLKVGGTGNTPAKQIFEEKAAVQSEAESAIQQDDFVQALMKDFGANIIPSSIKPV